MKNHDPRQDLPSSTSQQMQARGTRPEPLLRASEVAAWLNIDRRRVYELPVDQIRISNRCVRWRLSDLEVLIEKGTRHLGFE